MLGKQPGVINAPNQPTTTWAGRPGSSSTCDGSGPPSNPSTSINALIVVNSRGQRILGFSVRRLIGCRAGEIGCDLKKEGRDVCAERRTRHEGRGNNCLIGLVSLISFFNLNLTHHWLSVSSSSSLVARSTADFTTRKKWYLFPQWAEGLVRSSASAALPRATLTTAKRVLNT